MAADLRRCRSGQAGVPREEAQSWKQSQVKTVSLELFQSRGGQRPRNTFSAQDMFSTTSREQGNSFHSGNYKSVYKPLCQSCQHPLPSLHIVSCVPQPVGDTPFADPGGRYPLCPSLYAAPRPENDLQTDSAGLSPACCKEGTRCKALPRLPIVASPSP
jgi:hypothetical protein